MGASLWIANEVRWILVNFLYMHLRFSRKPAFVFLLHKSVSFIKLYLERTSNALLDLSFKSTAYEVQMGPMCALLTRIAALGDPHSCHASRVPDCSKAKRWNTSHTSWRLNSNICNHDGTTLASMMATRRLAFETGPASSS